MPDSRTRLYNTLTLALLALSAVACAVYAVLFVAAPRSIAALPTETLGPIVTPTPSRTPRPTNTLTHTPGPSNTPTATPVITVTLTGRETRTRTPTPGPTHTPSPTLSPFNYVASVEYQRSIYGQNWAGIAGLVYGLDGKHQTNILVRAWGDPPLGSDGLEIPSGIAVQYGVSGFEFTLGDKPVEGKWSVQLIGDDGMPLSDVIPVEMNSDPRLNLAYIVFMQNH
jgi:hypothetical protein